MIIAIDMVGTNKGSGTKTYNLNFCEHLHKQNIKEKIYIFITKNYLKNMNLPHRSNINYIFKPIFLENIFFRIIWMQLFLPFELKKLKVNQLFSPMNIGPIFIKFFKIKLTLGLHSNLPWTFFSKMPGNFFRKVLTKYFMESSIRNCDKLIVNSNFAKNEIIQFLKIKEDKIFVVHLGVNKKYLENEINDFYLNDFEYKDYILSVISCAKYHNILNLLKAFKILTNDNDLNLKFVLVLQILDKKYFNEIKKFVKDNFRNNEIIFFHNLDNKYLINLYKNARFYIFSSYSEVFGLTSLEAMSQDCPVLISDSSALREINSNASVYFNPDNEVEIKDCMNRILNDVDYREKIVNLGKIHSKKFRWDKTLKETLKILLF